MKLSYCLAPKETLTKRYNKIMDKIAYEKLKNAIIECLKIAMTFCVGGAFISFCIAYDLNYPDAAMYGIDFIKSFGSGMLQVLWGLWMMLYLIVKMPSHNLKEFAKEIGGMVARVGVATGILGICMRLLIELARMLVA